MVHVIAFNQRICESADQRLTSAALRSESSAYWLGKLNLRSQRINIFVYPSDDLPGRYFHLHIGCVDHLNRWSALIGLKPTIVSNMVFNISRIACSPPARALLEPLSQDIIRTD